MLTLNPGSGQGGGDGGGNAQYWTDQGEPAHERLQALAARKLPEVDALIERAQTMRDWLTAASARGCETLDACALFADGP